MAEKKRSWNTILSEILKGNTSEKNWEDFFSQSKSFQQFADGNYWADHCKKLEWAKRFLKSMIAIAKQGQDPAHWRKIARCNQQGSHERSHAIDVAYTLTNRHKKNILYAWQALRRLLKKDDPLYFKVSAEISRIRRFRKTMKVMRS